MSAPLLLAAACVTLAVLVLPGRGAAPARAADALVPRRGDRARAPVPAVETASVMELLALTLRSGSGVVEALEAVGAGDDDVCGAHLLTVAAALRWGVDDGPAWEAVPDAWRPAAQALTLAGRAGAPPADLLLAAADDVRRAERHRLEAATARLGVRVVLPLGLTFLPAFVLSTVVPVVLALTSDVLGG